MGVAISSAVTAGPAEKSAGLSSLQSRARHPEAEGFVERDGVRLFYEVYGEGEPTVLLLPTWSILHSRFWKGQIAYLARHCRVVTFDGRGNGRSDRPAGAAAYHPDEFALDTLAVMDATGTERASLVAFSCGARWAAILAAEHAARFDAAVFIGPALALAPSHAEREEHPFDEPLATEEGWAKYNSHYWRKDYHEFLQFFFEQCCNEPHSSKQIEDAVAWGSETDAEVLADTTRGLGLPTREPVAETCARITCPTLVIHGDLDLVRPHAQGRALAAATGGRLVTLHDAGHMPIGRDPVRVNLLLRDFLCPPAPPRSWRRSASRARRALYISSPIGLGHARRDLAIADQLRVLRPDLEIDWLAQHPVTEMLAARGERIHPASAELSGESAHMQSESRGHALPCFQAMRRMDEILLSNFMVFLDVVREQPYDLWIGDEAWELDYFLHENPELKSAPYAWLTDFVGWLPMPAGDAREAALTADYNAEMIEQVARYPRVRDCSIFVGDPEDIVDDRFGPSLPSIREWTERHYSFCGYVTDFDPVAGDERSRLRAELGYGEKERVCIVTVGGSGVGVELLRRVIGAFPEASERVPDLRMIVVAGPRIDPESLPSCSGVEVLSYVHDLHRHLAVCDLAIVQGGLSTSMELIAQQRPFLYFPLREHFEQNLHVRHRLERYGALRCMDFEDSTPEVIAAAIEQEIGRKVSYLEVNLDGASRAARSLAELL